MVGAADAMISLSPFVGIWNTKGSIKASDKAEEQTLFATDIYEWLPGKCFLLHRVDARMGDDITRSTEVIGWDADEGTLFSTSYDARGGTTRFSCALDGQDWRIDGPGIRFRGAFDRDWNKLTGIWELAGSGLWSPWMDISLTRAD